jgi:hypothetical protein
VDRGEIPVLRRITGTDRSATEMTHDHRKITRLTDELEQITDEPERGQGDHGDRAQPPPGTARLPRSMLSEHFGAEESVCFAY